MTHPLYATLFAAAFVVAIYAMLTARDAQWRK